MSERLFNFFDEVLQRHFDLGTESYPQVRRADVDRLLSDDTRRRVAEARIAAVEWANTEKISGNAVITSDRLIITPHGLLYTAGLTGSSTRHTLYYLAAPPALFESIVELTDTTLLPPESTAVAVDDRFGHELTFPWPLDATLRRMLDDHQVLCLDLFEEGHSAQPTVAE
ncbi:glucose-6-phosphate dehydrogenase [Rhodococcus sp. ARC_M6]|uniref:glucose-6-phosphate dehydrogenase n=1 Tax=Rhodococcus sp. ARC_M6 TaxID=2928852 RepID=UPI001FB51A16|nr:glucose-6-phosphate dehydrogenase [Rhodococcus sp. ARC_M6]MCJ0902474.1 glucose-6-phosphate dehydrogenase [Rhodococcus sp. ARC_M6]